MVPLWVPTGANPADDPSREAPLRAPKAMPPHLASEFRNWNAPAVGGSLVGSGFRTQRQQTSKTSDASLMIDWPIYSDLSIAVGAGEYTRAAFAHMDHNYQTREFDQTTTSDPMYILLNRVPHHNHDLDHYVDRSALPVSACDTCPWISPMTSSPGELFDTCPSRLATSCLSGISSTFSLCSATSAFDACPWSSPFTSPSIRFPVSPFIGDPAPRLCVSASLFDTCQRCPSLSSSSSPGGAFSVGGPWSASATYGQDFKDLHPSPVVGPVHQSHSQSEISQGDLLHDDGLGPSASLSVARKTAADPLLRLPSTPSLSSSKHQNDAYVQSHNINPNERYFIEFWSGHGGLSDAFRQHFLCIEPVEAHPMQGPYREDLDLSKPSVKRHYLDLARSGCIGWAHFGIPCATFGLLSILNGGTRRKGKPLGDGVMPRELNANLNLDFACAMIRILSSLGGLFSLENPLRSYLFQVPQVLTLYGSTQSIFVDLDQCAFGLRSPKEAEVKEIWKKPTRIWTNVLRLASIARTCPGSHVHTIILDSIRVNGRSVKRSILAGRYPAGLCKAIVAVATSTCRCQPTTSSKQPDQPRTA